MTNYRLDRRFALPAVGTNMILAGLTAALAFFLASVTVLAWVFGVACVAALLNALRVFAFPPVVARTDPSGLRLGGPMTGRPVQVPWLAVENVTTGDGRLFVDRGSDETVAFPLAYVGGRAPALLRDIYDRLNTANGYRRFDPS